MGGGYLHAGHLLQEPGEEIAHLDVLVCSGGVILVEVPDPDDLEIPRGLFLIDFADHAFHLGGIALERALPRVLGRERPRQEQEQNQKFEGR
jgi:hypothetical protein